MTQTGPAAQDDVLLPQGWSEANQASSLLFRLDGLELHLISGSRFEAVADAVGTLRESTYRQQLSGSGRSRDLDGRDEAYDHLILLEPAVEPWRIARLQFVPQFTDADCFPAASSPTWSMSTRDQVFLAEHPSRGNRSRGPGPFQRQPHSLMALFRGGS